MITEKEIHRLEKSTSKKSFILIHIAMLALVLSQLSSGIYKFILAHELAIVEDVPFRELFCQIDIHEDYSGIFVTAKQWIIEGSYSLVISLAFIAQWLFLYWMLKQKKQILELRKKQANSLEQKRSG